MSQNRWTVKIELPKKSVKTVLLEVGLKVLEVTNAPKNIGIPGIWEYNIINKLQEQINKLDEATAEKVLEEIRRKVNDR